MKELKNKRQVYEQALLHLGHHINYESDIGNAWREQVRIGCWIGFYRKQNGIKLLGRVWYVPMYMGKDTFPSGQMLISLWGGLITMTSYYQLIENGKCGSSRIPKVITDQPN